MTATKNNEIETKRLLLKPILESDFDQLYKLYRNPNVMKQIYDGGVLSKEMAEQKTKGFVQHWQNHGFGMWMLHTKEQNEAIGYAGFRYFEDKEPELKNKIELGYIIDEPYWEKGYAKEAVLACIEAGLNHFNLKCILATILPENINSQKVAMNAGMHHSFDIEINEKLHHVYEIKK